MLENNRFVINKETLCLLHAEVAKEEALQWGVFREGNVNIGGTEYLPPRPQLLDSVFNEGFVEINRGKIAIIKALTYFLFGARTQFFYDGNKRVSRLMMNGILLSAGFPMLNIKVKNRLEFNKQMISFYNSEDYVTALEYLRDYYLDSNRHISS
jgi:Fic family protein